MHLCWYDSSLEEFAAQFARFQTSRFDRIRHIATVVYVDHIFGEESEDLVQVVLEYLLGLRRKVTKHISYRFILMNGQY